MEELCSQRLSIYKHTARQLLPRSYMVLCVGTLKFFLAGLSINIGLYS